MFRMIKRLAFVVLVPTVVGLGAWSQWTTFTINGEVVGTSIAGPIPADVTRGTRTAEQLTNRERGEDGRRFSR